MLRDCLNIFEQLYEKEGDRLILDNYIPSDGSYILVNSKGEIAKVKNFQKPKGIKEPIKPHLMDMDEFIHQDYLSKLISMNKPMDKTKVVHSNNYLSFWVKKESILPDKNGKTKLNIETIAGYYETLAHPEKKYSKKALQLYKTLEEQYGVPDNQLITKNQSWIEKNIFDLIERLALKPDKTYLKIFFEAPENLYVQESERYVLPNIYNTTNYNVEISGEIYGLPNDNMGMNAKKPYLDNKSRKNTMPYLVSLEEAKLQKKLFDYLYNQANEFRNNIYFSETPSAEIEALKNNDKPSVGFSSGYYMRIKKGKELEIHDFDQIPSYKRKIEPVNFIQTVPRPPKSTSTFVYDSVNTLDQLELVIHDVFFNKFLMSNYFSEDKDIRLNDAVVKEELLKCRRGYHNWFYRGNDSIVKSFFDKSSLRLIKNSIVKGNLYKAIDQFNVRQVLKQYLKGAVYMGSQFQNVYSELYQKVINKNRVDIITSDKEYYFAVGQLSRYFLSLSQKSQKVHSMVNPILNACGDRQMKEFLRRLFRKYNYTIYWGTRFDNLYRMVLDYEPQNPRVDQDAVIEGYLYGNLMYDKGDNEENGGKENE